jgi:hypothetical protein
VSDRERPTLQRTGTRLFCMAEPAQIPTELEEPPTHDPHAAARAYHHHRARRAARIERRRERKWARLRFWLVLVCLLLAVAVIGVLVLQQVQNVFGI